MADPASTFSRASHGRLTAHDLGRFTGESLFDRSRGRCARPSACRARSSTKPGRWRGGCAGVCRGGRVVDLGGGHGLLAHVMLLLDDSSPAALVVDPTLPPSHQRLHQALVASGRGSPGACPSPNAAPTRWRPRGRLIASCHGCGRLTDAALDLALGARARVAVLPCCHDHVYCETGELAGWMRPIWRSTRRGRRDSASRVSDLDEDDSGRGHAAQPAPDRGADRRGVSRAHRPDASSPAYFAAASTFLTTYSLVPHSPVAFTVISVPASLMVASWVITAASSATS